MMELEYRIAGDKGILVKFGNEVNEETFQRIVSFEKQLLQRPLVGISETIRSYCTLFVGYDPSITNQRILIGHLKQISRTLRDDKVSFPKTRIIVIPVLYGGEWGPDLPLLAQILGISQEEVIRRHLAHDYLIYITAFLGGAAFFKGTDRIFEVPRKKTPVLMHPQGTVNLANGIREKRSMLWT